MRAQHFAQRRMHQVRRGVIAAGGITLFDIDLGGDCIADLEGSPLNLDSMNNQTLSRRVSVQHLRYRCSTRILRVTHGRDARATDEVSTVRVSGLVNEATY